MRSRFFLHVFDEGYSRKKIKRKYSKSTIIEFLETRGMKEALQVVDLLMNFPGDFTIMTSSTAIINRFRLRLAQNRVGNIPDWMKYVPDQVWIIFHPEGKKEIRFRMNEFGDLEGKGLVTFQKFLAYGTEDIISISKLGMLKKSFPAQELYDLRELTGMVSGNDLHEAFQDLLGEPSPSGKREIAWKDFLQHQLAKIVFEEVADPQKFAEAVLSYSGHKVTREDEQLRVLFFTHSK